MTSDLVESFSGVRGIYGQGITEDLAKQYVFCYCQLFEGKLKTVVVGGDTRPSTPALKKVMTEQLQVCGVQTIIDIGVAPVQVTEYAVLHFQADGGVYISASHNEPEYNGWKFLKEDGAILYPEQSDKLISLVHQAEPGKIWPQNGLPSVKLITKEQEAIEAYLDYVLDRLGEKAQEKISQSGFKVLADPNGGSAVVVLEKLFARLNAQAEIINSEIGKFVRLVEPKEESLTFLADKMAGNDFDFACGFDADADRVEFVLSSSSAFAQKMGTPNVSGQYVLALACDAILKGTSGQVVATNDATSCLVRDVIKKHGAIIKEVGVGETNVVKSMEENKSIIGGEGSCSGVIVFPIKCRDGIITVALVLKLMAEAKKPLPEILSNYPAYFSDRTKVACQPDKALTIRAKLEEYFQNKGWEIKKTGDETGGLRACPDENSFIFFRQSKTEPGTFRIHTECDVGKQKAKDLLEEGIKAFKMFSC